MDLLTAVAVSILPRRGSVANVLLELRQGGHEITLELLLDAIRIPPEDRSRIVSEGLASARVALEAAGSTAWNHSHGSSLAIRPCWRVWPTRRRCCGSRGTQGLGATGGRKSSVSSCHLHATGGQPLGGGAGRAGDRRGERSRQRG